MAIYGLKDATQAEIDQLKQKHPNGCHVTHKLNGSKLPFNGVFFTFISDKIRTWAIVNEQI